MSLDTYNKKRSFEKTPEPKGIMGRRAKGALRFVVQKHDASHLHYDFRLELDGILKSWAVPKGPSLDPHVKRLAMETEDHPLSYGDFEGTIPKGQYGAGDVIVWDNGVYMSDKTADLEESRKQIKQGYYEGEITFVLLGEKLKGAYTLVKTGNRGKNAWLLIKQKDAYASKEDVTADVRSVVSKRLLPRDVQNPSKQMPLPKNKRKKRDPMPTRIRPMLAKLVDAPFDKDGWYFEPKWDGYRSIAEITRGKVSLYSRNGLSFTARYAPIVDALKSLKEDCILDGEIIALKDGVPDFHTLQRYEEDGAPLSYAVFDLLYYHGKDLRAQPLSLRKHKLREILPQHPLLLYSEHVERNGKNLFERMAKEHFEGVLAKDAKSPYREGTRSDEWLKIKTFMEQEAIILGYTAPRGSRKRFGALVLGAYEDGTLRYIGHSGGGFTAAELEELYQKLSKIKTRNSPLTEKVPINSTITWVRPRYVVEMRFTEWTRSGRMRHPIYTGLRVDKKPQEVQRELPKETPKTTKTASTADIKFTNTEKVFWPQEGYTKGDVIEYYDSMADVLLPYLKDRPQNLRRSPNGINGKDFFQKNVTAKLPSYVETKEIWSESNNAFLRYIVCNNKETLLYLANLGCIELNPWSSRVQNLQKPDYMILDLDPHDRPFEDLIRVAREVKKVLDQGCEEHYPKTSGKTGLHIVVPLGGRYSYDGIRAFSELIMRLVYERLPEITSLERDPRKRKDKIYLDYLQNRFGQTISCAYSIRPFPDATVSTPLMWSEVRKGLDPAKFTIKTIGKRIEQKGDLWKPVLGRGVDLPDAIRCLEELVKK